MLTVLDGSYYLDNAGDFLTKRQQQGFTTNTMAWTVLRDPGRENREQLGLSYMGIATATVSGRGIHHLVRAGPQETAITPTSSHDGGG
jgi:hypothetical protein